MKILERYVRNDVNELTKNDIRVSAIGDLKRLPRHLKDAVKDAVLKTAHCQKLTITLALSYGAWEEVVFALKSLLAEHKEKPLTINQIDEQLLKKHLYTKDLPDPDLFIRTGGEVRLSNFLLLQISYSELYFCKTLWPDFQRADLDQALEGYVARKRRFGTISSD